MLNSFDLRGSQDSQHPLTQTGTGWGPKLRQFYLLETLPFMPGLYLGLVVQGCPTLLGMHSFPLSLMAALTWGTHQGGFWASVRKSEVSKKAKAFLGYFGWAHIAATTRFGGGSILGGHCAAKGGGNSSSGGKPHFFKFLTLQHILKCFFYGL